MKTRHAIAASFATLLMAAASGAFADNSYPSYGTQVVGGHWGSKAAGNTKMNQGSVASPSVNLRNSPRSGEKATPRDTQDRSRAPGLPPAHLDLQG